MKVGIIVFDGADEMDFIGPLEILRAVTKAGKEAQVRLLSAEPQSQVVCSFGLKLQPDACLDEAVAAGELDLVVVPGGGWLDRSPKGAWHEFQRGVLPKKIAQMHAQGTILAGVCTGTILMAEAGILKGRPAITHQRAIPDLEGKAEIVQARVVDAGDVITCGGVTASLDLALWIVERFWGAALADGIAKFMEYTRSRDIHVAANVVA